MAAAARRARRHHRHRAGDTAYVMHHHHGELAGVYVGRVHKGLEVRHHVVVEHPDGHDRHLLVHEQAITEHVPRRAGHARVIEELHKAESAREPGEGGHDMTHAEALASLASAHHDLTSERTGPRGLHRAARAGRHGRHGRRGRAYGGE